VSVISCILFVIVDGANKYFYFFDAGASGDVQPVTLATVDNQLAGTSQHQQLSTTAAASLSVATAMASVAMAVGFIYHTADAATVLPRPHQQRCTVAPDGSHSPCLCYCCCCCCCCCYCC